MCRKWVLGVTGFCLAVALGGSFVQAETVKAKLLGDATEITNFGISVKTLDGTTHSDGGGAGRFHWDGSGQGNTDPRLQGTFTSFCTDIKDFIQYGETYTYNLNNLATAPIQNGTGQGINTDLAGGMGTQKADRISALYGQHYSDVVDKDTASAFQLAIWEIVYEPTLLPVTDYNVTSFSSGGFGFAATGGDPSLANSWLNTLDLSPGAARLSLGALTSTDRQDQIVIIPLPTSLSAGLGLLGVLLIGKQLRPRMQMAN